MNLSKCFSFVLFGFLHIAMVAQVPLYLSDSNQDDEPGEVNNKNAVEVNLLPGYEYIATSNRWMNAYIDVGIILDDPGYVNSYNQAIAFDNYPLDESAYIGSIPFSYSGTNNGGLGIHVPIATPCDDCSVKPSLSLDYNSSNRSNGLVGRGWGLSVNSAIVRTGNSLITDGGYTPLKLNNEDNYIFDGNRLVCIEGTSGIDGSQYKTEVNTYVFIELHESTSSDEGWFSVKTKDGRTLEYGNTGDSKVFLGDEDVVIQWNLNKVTDPNGNYMEYKYRNENGQVLIDEINYGGNTIVPRPHIYKVKFIYAEREDNNIKYYNGTDFPSNFLISQIRTFSNGYSVYKYKLKYGMDASGLQTIPTGSELFEISLQTSEDDFLNPLRFKYDHVFFSNSTLEMTDDVVTNLPLESGDHDYEYRTGDFNGDGLTDFLQFEYNHMVGYRHYIAMRMFERTNSGQYSLAEDFHFSEDEEVILRPGRGHAAFAAHKGAGLYNFDINGDLKDDVVIVTSVEGTLTFTPYYTPQANSSNIPFAKCTQSAISGIPTTAKYLFGDYNGDSKIDLFVWDEENEEWLIHFFHLKQGFEHWECNSDLSHTISGTFEQLFGDHYDDLQNSYLTHPTSSGSGIRGFYPINFDDDPTTEILSIRGPLPNNAGIGIVHSINFIIEESFNSSGDFLSMDFTSEVREVDFTVGIGNTINLSFGDHNGDGLTDILTRKEIPNSNNYEWRIFTNKGDYSFEITYNNLAAEFGELALIQYADINSDGISDFVEVNENYFVNVYYSFGLDNYVKKSYANGGFNFSTEFFSIEDADGDGLVSLLYDNEDHVVVKSLPEEITGSGNIIKLADSYNNYVEFEYATPIESVGTHYLTNFGALLPAYPLTEFIRPYELLTHISKRASDGTELVTSFKYYNATAHLRGKGLLGFGERQQKNEISGIYEVTVTAFDGPHNSPLPYLSRTKLGLTKLNETMLFHNVFEDDGIYSVSISQKDEMNNITHVDVTTSYPFYDDYNNPLLIVEETGSELINEIRTTEMTYENFGSWWAESRLASRTITDLRYGNDPKSISEDFSYNDAGNLTLYKYRYLTDAEQVTEYIRNDIGLVESVKESGYGLPQLEVATYSYDPLRRRKISETDKFGFTTSYEYNNRWGKIKRVTDYVGKQENVHFDAFGQVEEKIDFLGQKTIFTKEFEDVSAGFANNCDTENESDLFIKETSVFLPGTPHERYSKTYYNRLGEARKNISSSQFGDKISTQINCFVSETGSDGIEMLIKKSTPRFSDDLVRITEMRYNDFNQLVYSEFGSQNSTYTYGSLPGLDGQIFSSSSNISGDRNSKTDVTGRIVERNDAGGVLNFNFDSGGLQKSISLNTETIVESTYDNYGRQLTLNDKFAAGLTSYTYDSYDRIASQTDAKDYKHSNTYNEYGQPEVRDVSMDALNIGSYSYLYYTTGTNKHKIKNETAPSGHATNYEYDDEGNISSIEEVVDDENLKTSYEYDEKGKPLRKIYPSGFAIRYLYDEKDYLKKIVSDDYNLIIWEVNHIDAQNNLTNYTLGNGVTVAYEYDDEYFFPKSYKVTAGNDELIEFNYNFDEVTGNLKNRNLGNSDEHFFYDENGLNRLVGTGPEADEIQEQFEIAPNGNILEKENVGEYSYHETKKFAVNKIDLDGGVDEGDLVEVVGMQNISYNHFNSASSIENVDEQIRLDLEYGPDDQRRAGKYYDVSGQQDVWLKTRYYAGSYEKQIDAEDNEIEVHYISAGDHLVAMYVIQNGQANYFYPHKDHLGSILFITDESGNLLQDDVGNTFAQSFDAWGRPRNPDNFSYDNIASRPDWLWRGYTGHEQLDEFGLINMNGRLYDPVVGRMLSPDNYVQKPDFTQSYNRYSYVWNNPLKYTDPNGEWVHLVIGAVIGGINGYITGKQAGLDGWALVGTTLAGSGVGLATAGVGSAVASSSGVIAGSMIGGAVNGAGNGLISGIAAGQDFKGVANSTLGGLMKGVVIGTVGGSVGGLIGGGAGAFFGGAVGGALGTALNGGSADDILKSALIGGTASYGLYHMSQYISYKDGCIQEETGLKYGQYAKMMRITQRSMFLNREGKYIPNKIKGHNLAKLGKEHSVGAKSSAYDDALLDYHTHSTKGSKLADGDGFSTYASAQEHYGNGQMSDEYTRTLLNNGVKFDGQMWLGTREGSIHFMNSNFSRGTLSYNFGRAFMPYQMLHSTPIY